MTSFTVTVEAEIEVTYTIDKEIRQGENARYPSEAHIDDVSYELMGQSLQGLAEKEAQIHFEEGE